MNADHERPQAVQWIEELIGRRQSPAAHAVMAVSSSGFTRSALAKAAKHGVAVRDLRTLTDSEVRAWGRSVSLTLYYYQYSAPELVLGFKECSPPSLNREAIREELARTGRLPALFNAVANVVGPELAPRADHEGRSVTFDVAIDPDGFSLCGHSVVVMRFRGTASLLRVDTRAPLVVAYGEPGADIGARLATVERFDVGHTSIVRQANRMAVHVDISTVELPPLCQFRFASVHAEEEVEHESFSLVGIDRLCVRTGRIGVTLLVENGTHDGA